MGEQGGDCTLRRVGGGCSQLNAEGSSWLLRAEQTPPTEGVPVAIPACSPLQERIFLTLSNYIFTAVFLAEMTVKVMGAGGGSALDGSHLVSGCGAGRAGERLGHRGGQGWGVTAGRRQCW